ncbi:Hypothetical protein ETEE_0247 [Edwardsiella anguillarum ET080813]|uniref:Uncharacterized protein n=1 Tax=Edwardsiella anguillarum ET080813 TaxID=667120 RepID=A0A076LIL2_9GAMM|nr:Hypothetical protein ETEE_0247 [Edwardsiella anguillarum ET080813]
MPITLFYDLACTLYFVLCALECKCLIGWGPYEKNKNIFFAFFDAL